MVNPDKNHEWKQEKSLSTNVKKKCQTIWDSGNCQNIFSSTIHNPLITTSFTAVPGPVSFKLYVDSAEQYASPSNLVDNQWVSILVFNYLRFVEEGMGMSADNQVHVVQ